MAAEQFIAENTLKGDVISKTGGARKIRVAAKGHGKSGGARIIYYYQRSDGIIHLFTAYAKNQQPDLSEKDKKELYKIIQLIERGGTHAK